jgi:hypothetical protein
VETRQLFNSCRHFLHVLTGLPQPNIVAKDTIDLAAKAAEAWRSGARKAARDSGHGRVRPKAGDSPSPAGSPIADALATATECRVPGISCPLVSVADFALGHQIREIGPCKTSSEEF